MFIIQFVLALSISWFEITRLRRVKIDVMSMFSLVYFICFVIAPISGYYMFNDEYNVQSYSVFFNTIDGKYDFSSSNFYITGLLTLIAYWIIILVFRTYRPSSKTPVLGRVFEKKIPERFIYIIGILFLLISVAVLCYIQVTQGIGSWLTSNPRAYMSGDREELELESLSWTMDKLLRFGIFSSLLFWGLNYSPNANNRFPLVRVLFLISFFLSCILIYRIAGRLVFFRYFAVFFLAYLFVKQPKYIYLKSLLLIVFGIIFILYGRLIFRFFLYNDHVVSTFLSVDDSAIESYFKFISNFTFPFFSASKNIDYINHQLYWFKDLFLLPFSFMPEKFLGISYISSSEINTYRVWGVRGESGNPSDMFSYALINAGYIGVLLVSFVFGIVLKKLNTLIGKLNNSISTILFVYLAFTIVFLIMYCDPQHFFKGSIEFWLGIGLIFLVSKVRRGQNMRLIIGADETKKY